MTVSIAEAVEKEGIKKVCVLGTDEDSVVRELKGLGIEVIFPDSEDRKFVDKVIDEELPSGNVSGFSRENIKGMVNELTDAGARGLVLTCPKLSAIVKGVEIPIFS